MELKRKQISNWIKLYSSFHIPNGEKNIFLFSTPRSGSTWLTELISTQPQFKMVKEPFNIRKDYVRENLGLNTWEDILDPTKSNKIAAYLNSFIDGTYKDIRLKRPVPFSPLWKPITSRIIFKILFAGESDFNWFKENFNGEIIFLLRHPIPVALSREICPRLDSFINSAFIEYFNKEEKQYAESIIKDGTPFEKSILDWCFQNVLPLRTQNDAWLTVSYEQTVLQPEIVIDSLLNKFHFKKPEKIRDRLNTASGSTVKSSEESKKILLDPDQIHKNKKWLVEKWEQKIDDAQHKKAFEILDAFGIDYYEYKNFLPKEKYLLK
ncbi:hypothetical protein [Chondrinema litorale]|uniref:hypothetical protein n=1 Tax=Chondrinema litorale TaxID=2994555 RepID=UPI0025433A8C|nr:hypothetical protein [Chondrinema litorale]UZS00180.1 hypothetical protein OQ292_40195 [Chondrinema litorale]